MPENTPRDWQCPSQATSDVRKRGWLNEATEEGQNWLRSQRGYVDWRKSLDIISGKADAPDQVAYRSKIKTNRLKRNIREIVGGLSNIRPLWGFHSDNPAFIANASMMNKVSRAVYLEQFFDRSLKEVLQYAAATCTGWARPVYRRSQAGRGKGNIQLLSYGAPSVVPVQMPASNDWQEAYAVTLLDEMPIYMAHSRFPEYQEQLQPTTSQYWYAAEIRTAASGNMWKRLFSGNFKRPAGSAMSDLYIPIRYTTIIDNTINKTGRMIPMGEIGSEWYYEVTSLGEEIPTGTGTYRNATPDDARLSPYRRLMI